MINTGVVPMTLDKLDVLPFVAMLNNPTTFAEQAAVYVCLSRVMLCIAYFTALFYRYSTNVVDSLRDLLAKKEKKKTAENPIEELKYLIVGLGVFCFV